MREKSSEKEISIICSSTAEYLIFITATGESDVNAIYFEEQLQRIREIRLSERRFYQKVTDIYATSIDYDPKAQTTRLFCKGAKSAALGYLWRNCSRGNL